METDKNYSQYLQQFDESDVDLTSDSENDECIIQQQISSTSSSTSSDDEEVPPKVVATSRGRARGRGRGRGRGQGRARGRASAQSRTNMWTENPFVRSEIHLHQPSYNVLDKRYFSPVDFFTQYIDEDIINTIVNASNRTYLKHNGVNLNLTTLEFKKFVGITFMMLCLQLPQIKMYFSKEYGNMTIKNAMTRSRFFSIRNSLKVVYDDEVTTQNKTDRLWKVRPLLERVRNGCNRQIKEQHLSLDEMMIPFTGQCNVKQYLPSKSSPFGLKNFALANPNGLICDFEIYQGRDTFEEETGRGFSLCEAAVLTLTKSLVPGHIVYIDRFFTTFKGSSELLRRGIRCTGKFSLFSRYCVLTILNIKYSIFTFCIIFLCLYFKVQLTKIVFRNVYH